MFHDSTRLGCLWQTDRESLKLSPFACFPFQSYKGLELSTWFYLFISLFGCTGALLLWEGSVELWSRELPSAAVPGASPCGFPSCGGRCTPASVTAFPALVHGLSSVGAWARGLSCSSMGGLFPDQGLNLCPLHWQADCHPLDPQGSPLSVFNNYVFLLAAIMVCLLVLWMKWHPLSSKSSLWRGWPGDSKVNIWHWKFAS